MNNMSLIDIYVLSENSPSVMDIKPSKLQRGWMDETDGMAYRCLPLNIANQYGWVCHSPTTFTATWDGRPTRDAISITFEDEKMSMFAQSHFGHGILTIPPDFLVRTEQNISIYVRGITNNILDNIYPLDGIVESDWLPFTFTMNYKFSKPGSVTFKKGDPIFMFFPIDRNFIEGFDITQKSIGKNKELLDKYVKYGESRQKHIDDNNPKPQKFYVSGTVVDEKPTIQNHKLGLKLKAPTLDFNEEI